jgi:hypothetical protein
MRLIAAGFILIAAACSPGGATTATSTVMSAATVEATAVPALVVTAVQLGGQWSFDRSCGLYDLIFTNTSVEYYDYTDPSHVVSYIGSYAVTGSSVALTLRRLNGHGEPSGDPVSYTLEVTAPPSIDLAGRFGRTSGDVHYINAKQCANEDRE